MRDLSEIKKANEAFEAREKRGDFAREHEDVSGFDNVDRTDEVGQENRCKVCDEFPDDCTCNRKRFPSCETCNGTGSVVIVVRDRIKSTAPCGMCDGSGQAGL